ncbi:hypothetical protein [Saccharopolyspora endophytica]|uniref:Uncharacterized protein n=1 Tax=Saccharopolyspora endophytica TaxID=543886 RepID=A0ABS5DHZ9_9PSEU|nr:hypothetical protein [Saccharopolyspora endophytica]MBQ0925914.1 hypothetical protein [Saccharopolyspora endophytica]
MTNGPLRSLGKSGFGLIFALVADISATVAVLNTPAIIALLRAHAELAVYVVAVMLGGLLVVLDLLFRKSAEVRSLKSEIASATTRDREAFKGALAEFSFDAGSIEFIKNGFLVTSWRRGEYLELKSAERKWREVIFDDPEVNGEFRRFLARLGDLIDWMARFGEPNPLDDHVNDDSERFRIIFSMSSEERDRAVGAGEYLAQEIIEIRRSFEKVGRQNGL